MSAQRALQSAQLAPIETKRDGPPEVSAQLAPKPSASRYTRASLAASDLAAWTLTEEFRSLGIEALPALARMALDHRTEANAAAARARAHRALRRLLRDHLAAGISVERAPG